MMTSAEKNEAAHADLLRRLEAISSWNDFARSLINEHRAGRLLRDTQIVSAKSMLDRMDHKAAQRAQADAARVVDLSPIKEMFEAAIGSGLKKPSYRALGLKITLAPAHGMNAGALYVVTEASDTYEGKIVGTTFKAVPLSCDSSVYDRLLKIAEAPLTVAIEYGRQTGRCACCGKELTNKESIELGIGPICKQKFGF